MFGVDKGVAILSLVGRKRSLCTKDRARKIGRDFVNGRLSSHLYATEPVVALMRFGYREGEGGKAGENVILKVWISIV